MGLPAAPIAPLEFTRLRRETIYRDLVTLLRMAGIDTAGRRRALNGADNTAALLEEIGVLK